MRFRLTRSTRELTARHILQKRSQKMLASCWHTLEEHSTSPLVSLVLLRQPLRGVYSPSWLRWRTNQRVQRPQCREHYLPSSFAKKMAVIYGVAPVAKQQNWQPECCAEPFEELRFLL